MNTLTDIVKIIQCGNLFTMQVLQHTLLPSAMTKQRPLSLGAEQGWGQEEVQGQGWGQEEVQGQLKGCKGTARQGMWCTDRGKGCRGTAPQGMWCAGRGGASSI